MKKRPSPQSSGKNYSMFDHAPHILAKRRAEEEKQAMEPLNKLALPLFGAIAFLVIMFAANAAWHVWSDWRETQRQNEVMVQCLNGHPVALGDAILRCSVQKFALLNFDSEAGHE